jgi:probable DNA repair protein
VLEAGGTIVVPSRQRALAVRLAWAQSQLQAARRSWAAPDVLHFTAWLQRCVDESRRALLGDLRRLGAHEEWLEWRRAALAAADGLELLQPAALADSLREAARLQRDWGLPRASQEGPEGELYERARARVAARCRALGAVQADDWLRLLQQAVPGGRPLLLAGFDSLGSALAERLAALGARRLIAPGGRCEPDRVVQARDLDDELQQAARWCRAQLLANPRARLLVIVPQLAQCRARAARTFSRVLQGGALLAGEPPEALHAIEGGQPLADYPLVHAALALLTLTAGEQSFSEVSAWLRSPYLGLGGLAPRVALELQLRDRNVVRARLDGLPALARRLLRGAAGELLAESLGLLHSAVVEPGNVRDNTGAWARRIADWLLLAGWPGAAPLGSEEQQQRARFEELLGEFAQLAPAAGTLRLADAVALLTQLAQRTLFEPATGDVPVTLTASLGDPLVTYEGIWVAGLNAEQWPRPARPDPFLGVVAQRAAGIAAASAAGQATLARAAMAAWRARAGELVLSCARLEGDSELQPSSLLGLGAPPEWSVPLPEFECDALRAALQAGARREPLPALPATALPAGQALPGGTRALGLQAQCPFHAFAELRLGARDLPEPAHGLPARERGVLLHASLQAVWQRLGGSAGLAGAQGLAREQLVQGAIASAIAGFRAQLVLPVAPLLLAIEARRLRALILQLLADESQRAPFTIVGLETMLATQLGGVPIDVRLDRIDELLDEQGGLSGHCVVIDYKSGRPVGFNPLAGRPEQAQLLAYGLLAPGSLAALATVHLREARVQWRGAAANSGTLPGLAKKSVAGAQWQAWQAHWSNVVPALALEVAGGVARVDPLMSACRHCHLDLLCRVGSTRHALGSEEPEVAADSLDDPPGRADAGASSAVAADD